MPRRPRLQIVPGAHPGLVDGAAIEAFLSSSVDLGQRGLLSAATRATAELLGDRGSCVLLDGAPRVALSTVYPDLSDWAINLGRYPEIEAAIEQRETIVIEDAHTDLRLESVRSLLPPQLRSIVVVPLMTKGRCAGVLLAQSGRAQRPTDSALATASLLGKIAARLMVFMPPTAEDASVEESQADRGDEKTRSLGPRKPRRVLIIDDEPDSAVVLADVLAREGFEATTATDGESGLEMARATRPDLVLLDMCMPRLDGASTAELLGEDLLTRNIPILFLSGSHDLATRVRGLRVQAMDFLSKPFGRDELLTRIERSLSHVEQHRQVRVEANLDDLTGLGNLRALRERLAIEQARWERYGTPLSVLTIDVDKLKHINDQHGHAAGSAALAAIGGVLKRHVRETDLAARYGGDEFVVVLPHARLGEAKLFAERALAHVREIDVDGVHLTVSIGVAALEGEPGETVENLLKRSDSAAYRAKRQGGDRVCAEGSVEPFQKPNEYSPRITRIP